MDITEKALIWFLRLSALMLLSAAGAVVLPYAWMNTIHGWLGMGVLSEQPLMSYLTRSLSALYATLGATYWYVSLDVRRYMPFIAFSVPLTLVFSVVQIGIDIASDLPIWWSAIEGPFLLVWTLVLWILVRRVEATSRDR